MGLPMLRLMVLAVLASTCFALPAPEEAVDSEAKVTTPDKQGNDGVHSVSVREFKTTGISPHDCLSSLYVVAFTSGVRSAGSDDGHAVELQTATEARRVRLYDRPGNDYYVHKGDLWKIPIREFYFTDSCITISELKGIALTEHSNDGWHIESVVTFLRAGDVSQLYTEDFEANRWIDGDSHSSFRRFDLNIVI